MTSMFPANSFIYRF